MPPNEAQSLKLNLRALAIFAPKFPFMRAIRSITKPRFNFPYDLNDMYLLLTADLKEVWLYDQESGQIFHKIKPRIK